MPVKNRLKEALKARDNIDLTQYKIEKDTGLGTGTARNLLREDYIPGGNTLVKICDTYNIHPGEFLFYEPLRN